MAGQAVESHWEKIRVDPANQCRDRGEDPHTNCDVALYEGNPAGHRSHMYAACRAHRFYWFLQSGGPVSEEYPTLSELGNDYARLRA